MPVQSPEELYGLPLPRFIPERTALAKGLRHDKKRDEAAAVAAMRKPSVAAWAVNQLVRTQASSIRALFKAGDELAKAQSQVAAGESDADALHAATRRQRDAIDGLLEAARGLLSSEGHPLTQSTLERVRETLRAASIDPQSREQVQDGCLHQELEFAGLGIGELSAVLVEGAPKRSAKPKPTKTRDTGQRAEAERKAEQARQAEADRARDAEAARTRKAALTAARKAHAGARRAATRAEKELAAAQTQQRDAAASLQKAEERLAKAAERAEATAAELTAAHRSLSELENT